MNFCPHYNCPLDGFELTRNITLARAKVACKAHKQRLFAGKSRTGKADGNSPFHAVLPLLKNSLFCTSHPLYSIGVYHAKSPCASARKKAKKQRCKHLVKMLKTRMKSRVFQRLYRCGFRYIPVQKNRGFPR